MPADPPPAWVLTRRRAIGARIRTAREAAKLTQETLGELVGADRKTINRIEHAISDPRLSLLILIADAIGVPLADLMRESPGLSATGDADRPGRSGD
ncbi:helix-turn-helix transcriptional regulator [Streptomyces lunaelactis]|uniref:helix-turn-helix transcriptional regulator n=1 Tax=Streptomyces lunaelactis TaxID=1535768 RepID=UPI001584B00D|nr:helix-turn-helix transcriptional regulator [Streptomyces lunaelactis]NUK07446.1 helix-turn-helix transcriptional regulator [Streptomyces lunaelactis]